jgi:predicted GIY-YIG superfamily endonuclease
MTGYMHILECAERSYYTGSTNNLELRVAFDKLRQHFDKLRWLSLPMVVELADSGG